MEVLQCLWLTHFCFLIVEAAEIMRSICLAINHLHSMNIVHRDIKVRALSVSLTSDNYDNAFSLNTMILT